MKKPVTRILSLLLVALLAIGVFSGVLAMLAGPAGTVRAAAATPSTTTATPTSTTSAKIITADTTMSKSVTVGKVSTGLRVVFNFIDPEISYLEGEYLSNEFSMPLNSSFGWSYNTKLTIKEKSKGTGNNQVVYYEATLTNISYSGGTSRDLMLTIPFAQEDFEISVPIPKKYFKESGETEGAPASDIVVQSTIVRNSEGEKIGSVDKKTGRFTVEINFYDIGLSNEGSSAIDAAKKHVFITSPTGFKLHNGSSGTIERVNSSAQYPRFKATFTGVESTGTVNTIKFRVQYDFEEYETGVKGEGEATLFQVKTESEEDEEEPAPLKPNIIVQEYSYGKEPIVAGNEFELHIVFANTSRAVPVENVVMTVEPANGFLIAAASNTVYFPRMGAGETKPYSVALRALPSHNTTGNQTTPTDYSVSIKFSYQYLSKKEYATGETAVKIAVPVDQLDRFSADEIVDYSSYLTVGSEGYVTVPIINKGKSATMNISGTIASSDGGADFSSPPTHFGNLEAGKSGTLNITLIINTPGEFKGEAVISYEDENMNQKELRQPFTVMVDQPQMPQPEMPPPDITPQQTGVSAFSAAMFVLGGLMLASPVAMMLIKRIKAHGSEDIDEDF